MKMFKKFLNFLCSVCMLLVMMTPAFAATSGVEAEVLAATVTTFSGIESANGTLKAMQTSTEEKDILFESTDTTVSLELDNVAYSIDVDGAKILNVSSNGINSELLAVMPNQTYTRLVVLKENTLMYIDIAGWHIGGIGYNFNWYTAYVNSAIKSSDVSPFGSTSATKTYTNTTSVMGESFVETLVLRFSSDGDSTNTIGNTFYTLFSLLIDSKKTVWTDLSGKKTTTSTNSLYVNNFDVDLAAARGCYFNTMQVDFAGTKLTSSNAITLEFALGIPNTPISIIFNYPMSTSTTLGQYGRYTFPQNSSGYTTNAGTNLLFNYELRNVNDNLSIDMRSRSSNGSGHASPGLVYSTCRWAFTVFSMGNNNGVGTNPYANNDTAYTYDYITLK